MGYLTVTPTSAPGSFKQIGVWQSRYSPCKPNSSGGDLNARMGRRHETIGIIVWVLSKTRVFSEDALQMLSRTSSAIWLGNWLVRITLTSVKSVVSTTYCQIKTGRDRLGLNRSDEVELSCGYDRISLGFNGEVMLNRARLFFCEIIAVSRSRSRPRSISMM